MVSSPFGVHFGWVGFGDWEEGCVVKFWFWYCWGVVGCFARRRGIWGRVLAGFLFLQVCRCGKLPDGGGSGQLFFFTRNAI